jgi:hypothetical protein
MTLKQLYVHEQWGLGRIMLCTTHEKIRKTNDLASVVDLEGALYKRQTFESGSLRDAPIVSPFGSIYSTYPISTSHQCLSLTKGGQTDELLSFRNPLAGFA